VCTYSWRVPWTAGWGDLELVATQDVGPGDVRTSQSVVFHWPWYYHVPGLGLWGCVLLLLVGLKENRKRQAWLVLIPLGLVALVWRMPATLLSMPIAISERFGLIVVTGAALLAVLALVGDRLTRDSGIGRFLEAILALAALGVVSCLGYFGLASSTDALVVLVIYSICSVIALAGIVLAGRAWRGVRSWGGFASRLAFWMFIAAMGLSAILAVFVGLMRFDEPAAALLVVIPCIIASLVLCGVIYLVCLPFVWLAFASPLYRERFLGLLGLSGGAGRTPAQCVLATLAGSGPAQPTAKPVAVADVAGTWQFYLDELGRTVVVDFRPDGTFAQQILSNRDGVTACPGGTWRLEGPKVHLSNYVSARTGAPEARTWWMIDAPTGLGLFGGDAADPASYFRMTPLAPSVA